jgi:hypothetical protein
MNRKMMAALLLTSALITVAQPEPIRIDLGQKGAVVSPNLYGIFFEEISHAVRRHGTRRHPVWHTTGIPPSPASPPRCA